MDCVWSSYGDWSPCSVSCGTGGVEQRKRMVLQEAKNGGRECDRTKAVQTRKCRRNRPCPRRGTYVHMHS